MQNEQHRFLRKVVYNSDTTCWDWVGSKYRRGYGHFRRKINGKWVMYKSHRYSYEFYNGPIPEGAFVCHKCDTPGCVNPAHLFTGSAKDNTADMFSKGRKGIIRNPRHRLLNLEIAREIRSLKTNQPNILMKDIAVMFNTSLAQVSRIINNNIWKES